MDGTAYMEFARNVRRCMYNSHICMNDAGELLGDGPLGHGFYQRSVLCGLCSWGACPEFFPSTKCEEVPNSKQSSVSLSLWVHVSTHRPLLEPADFSIPFFARYARYKTDFYNWNLVFLVRRFAFCALSVFGGDQPTIQVFLACILCILSMLAQYYFQPFLHKRYDEFDNMCTFVILLYLIGALIFMNGNLPDWLPTALQLYLFVMTICALIMAGRLFYFELLEYFFCTSGFAITVYAAVLSLPAGSVQSLAPKARYALLTVHTHAYTGTRM